MIGVWAAAAVDRAAVAELPLELGLVADPRGAIAVVSGDGDWAASCLEAIAADARVVVVTDPTPSPAAALDELSASGVPVVLDRPRLRHDVAAAAVAALDGAALVTVECAAAGDLVPVVVDAVGWGRTLAGHHLALTAAASTPAGVLALFDAPGTPVTITGTARSGPHVGARLRATALAETRVEVVAGDAAPASVVVSSAAGAAALPTRFETSRRLTLRRAIAALEGGAADLAEWRHDVALAHALDAAARSNRTG